MPSSLGVARSAAPEWEDGLPLLFRDYTFQQYVVGPGNSYAFEAAKLTSTRHGTSGLSIFPNCLFLHGKPGLGKTHLMVAAARAIELEHPECLIRYRSAGDFQRELFASMLRKDAAYLRKAYRYVDVLLLDDMELLGPSGGHAGQQFHAFLNSLLHDGKTVLLSSASPLHQRTGLQDGPASWFGWGLVAEILPLDRDGRVHLIRNKLAEMEGRNLPSISEGGIQFLAEQDICDMRELKGLLNRILFQSERTMGLLSFEEVHALIATSLSS